MYTTVAVLGLIALVYAGIAGRVEKTSLTGPIIFLIIGAILGPSVAGVLVIDLEEEGIKTLAEFTLAIVLFTDAAKTDLGLFWKHRKLPFRMLIVGLPLTIAAGFFVGTWCFPGLPMIELAVLATMLAPTDAALGKSVIENQHIPAGIRSSLNVESGLNDGLAVPILFVFLAMAGNMTDGGIGLISLKYLAQEVGIGIIVGVATVLIASRTLKHCNERGWLKSAWMPVPGIAIAVICFSAAQALGGSGFISAFIGGLLYNRLAKSHKDEMLQATQGIGELFAMMTWIVFGAVVVPLALPLFTWQIILYAILSLTIVRMIPIGLSLIGSGTNTYSTLFLGWFGPRGLASIVFAVMVLGRGLADHKFLTLIVITTVIVSVFAHGLTAKFLGREYGPKMKLS